MRRPSWTLGLFVLSLASVVVLGRESEPRPGVDWPSFRGIRASGVADGFNTPATWNLQDSTNVLWKTPIAGLGHSSPVIWGDLVCVTTSIGGKGADAKPVLDATLVKKDDRKSYAGRIASIFDESELEWQVICLHKRTGEVAWKQTATRSKPATGRHDISTHANPTVATDGTHLVAFFGSYGIYGYRLSDGRLLWKRSFGLLDSGWFVYPAWQWGFASSPIIHKGKVIVQCDVQGRQFIAALDVTNGKELWRTPRNDVPSFNTPTVVTEGGKDQIVTNGWREIAAYDPETGARLWKIDATLSGGDIAVPTPVAGHGLVFITNHHKGTPIYAIRPSARGDAVLTREPSNDHHIAWKIQRDGAYLPTPIVYGDYFYNVKDNGIISAYEPTTGNRLYQHRLGGTQIIASTVAADGKLFVTGTEGDVFVVKAGPTFELLVRNSLDEPVHATPAISEGRLYFRTRSQLIAIGHRAPEPTASSGSAGNSR